METDEEGTRGYFLDLIVNVLFFHRGLGCIGVCICQNSKEGVLKICVFQCINLISKCYIKCIKTLMSGY